MRIYVKNIFSEFSIDPYARAEDLEGVGDVINIEVLKGHEIVLKTLKKYDHVTLPYPAKDELMTKVFVLASRGTYDVLLTCTTFALIQGPQTQIDFSTRNDKALNENVRKSLATPASECGILPSGITCELVSCNLDSLNKYCNTIKGLLDTDIMTNYRSIVHKLDTQPTLREEFKINSNWVDYSKLYLQQKVTFGL